MPDPTPGQARPDISGQLTPNNPAYYQQGNPGFSMTSNPMGQGLVLGASTQAASPLAPPPAAPAAPSMAAPATPAAPAGPDTGALLNTATQGINDNFNAYSSGIDQIKSNIDKQIADLQNGVGSQSDLINGQYNPNLQSLQSQQQQANQQVTTNQTQSIRDLEDNLRSQYSAANRQLGSVGAGDSSAVGQYAQAIADQGSKARAQVLQQAQQLHSQIGQQYSNQLNQLNGWKSNQILGLVNQFKAQQQQLDQQKIGANTDRVSQINALKLQLQQQATSALQQVGQQSSYWNDQLQKAQQDAQNRVIQFAQGLSGPQIDPSQFQALGNTQLQYAGPGGANGMTVQGTPLNTQGLDSNSGLGQWSGPLPKDSKSVQL
jgi:hypothetical protein